VSLQHTEAEEIEGFRLAEPAPLTALSQSTAFCARAAAVKIALLSD
jgi:hypothetical protein